MILAPTSALFWSPPTPPPGAFSDFLEALQPWESSLFHSIDMKAYPTEVASLLRSYSFISASDGSVKFTTHPWLVWLVFELA
jgi:hypothetical protein